MSEQELREGLLAAVADEPPLAFDPDTLMARAERETKRRRALFGAGLATAAVAVAAVAVPTMLGAPRGGGTAGSPQQPLEGCANESASALAPFPGEPSGFVLPSGPYEVGPATGVTPPFEPSGARSPVPTGMRPPTPPVLTGSRPPDTPPGPTGTRPPEPSGTPLPEPTAPPCPPSGEPPGSPLPPPSASAEATRSEANFEWPPPGIEAKQYTAAQLKQRAADMRTHLKSRFAKVVEGATNLEVPEFGGEASGAVSDGQNYLDTFVGYTRKEARSAVGISVFAPGGGMSPSEQCTEGGGTCTMGERPDGTRLVITTLQVGGQDNKASIVSVAAYRANGTVVRASGYNYDPVGNQGMKVLPEMPVTVEQLTALATDPELAL